MPKQYFHICNPTTPELPGCTNIVSKEVLLKINDDSNVVYLLHIHLNWGGNKLSSNYGFDIANLIRTEKKSKAPIFFYSAVQKEYFEQKSEKEIKYKILFGRGSAFIEAPFKEEVLNKLAASIEPLGKAALHDEVTMLCDLKGLVIDKLNHNLKFEANTDKVIGSISPYLSGEQKNLIQLEAFKIELKKSQESDDPELFLSEKLKLITLCNQRLSSQETENKLPSAVKYTVLLIDDVPEEIDVVREFLKDNFDIIPATSASKAIEILEADTNNKIVAVISDWRLYTDEKKQYWQSLQGYEILEYAAENGIRSLFALTSQADFVVHQLRNIMGLQFLLFKKENLQTRQQWSLFTEMLMQSCEITEETITNQPTAKQWTSRNRKENLFTYSLKDLYAGKRNTDPSFFTDLDLNASLIWQKYLNGDKIRYLLGELSTSEISESVLREVLLQRRIWIALFLNGETTEKIYQVMAKTANTSPQPNDLNQLKSKLCIVENEVKSGRLLPEEKNWLKQRQLL
ncbi:MAG: hypothetical protein U0U70_04255 [Chitinophagaceae bacterium]